MGCEQVWVVNSVGSEQVWVVNSMGIEQVWIHGGEGGVNMGVDVGVGVWVQKVCSLLTEQYG